MSTLLAAGCDWSYPEGWRLSATGGLVGSATSDIGLASGWSVSVVRTSGTVTGMEFIAPNCAPSAGFQVEFAHVAAAGKNGGQGRDRVAIGAVFSDIGDWDLIGSGTPKRGGLGYLFGQWLAWHQGNAGAWGFGPRASIGVNCVWKCLEAYVVPSVYVWLGSDDDNNFTVGIEADVQACLAVKF